MSTVQNNPTKLTNGRPAKLGVISTIATQSVTFVIPEPCRDYQGFCIIAGSGGAFTGTVTAILEGSLDGGNNWFSLTTSTNIVLGNTALLTGDNPVNSADAFQVNGMGAGCLFRFGYTGTGSITTPVTVWALVG